MAYFNQGTPQTQAPSLQVRGNPLAFLSLPGPRILQQQLIFLPFSLFLTPTGSLGDGPGERLELEDENNPFYKQGVLDLQRLARLFFLVEKH